MTGVALSTFGIEQVTLTELLLNSTNGIMLFWKEMHVIICDNNINVVIEYLIETEAHIDIIAVFTDFYLYHGI